VSEKTVTGPQAGLVRRATLAVGTRDLGSYLTIRFVVSRAGGAYGANEQRVRIGNPGQVPLYHRRWRRTVVICSQVR
jgi:hypothetical protein